MIACVDWNYGLGYKNKLLYDIPIDKIYFRRLTLGHTVVCGANTYKSLLEVTDGKLLPDREIGVLTHNSLEDTRVKVFSFINEVLAYTAFMKQDIWIIGGASIYKQFLPFAGEIWLGEYLGEPKQADAFFPKFDKYAYRAAPIYSSENYRLTCFIK